MVRLARFERTNSITILELEMNLNDLLYAGVPASKRSKMPNYVAFLRQVMAISGKGFRRYPMGHTGNGEDRRKDKLDAASAGVPLASLRYQRRYQSPNPRLRYPFSTKR